MPSFRKTFGEYLFVALTVIIGIVWTLWLVHSNHQAAQIKIAKEFKIAANERINVISQALYSNISVSNSVVSLFKSSDHVSSKEFTTFTAQILKDYPYIEALEWAPKVKGIEREKYEKKAKENNPDFMFKDIEEKGVLVKSAKRDIYHPVLYIEPVADYTKRVFGVDFMTHPVRRAALEEALETGRTIATSKITLLSSNQPGILYFSPVTKKNILYGFVVAAVPLNDVVTKAIEPLNKQGVNIVAHDVTNGTIDSETLFIHASRLKPVSDEEVMKIFRSNTMRYENIINMAGRKWQISVMPSEGFFVSENQNHLIIMFVGFGFTAMLAYFMVTHIRENVRIQGIVEDRTKELQQIARYDQLTGLANRRLFIELLNKTLSRANRTKTKVGVIYIDLNDFKPVNDRLGHAGGDMLLKEFGARATKILRTYDTVARLGGDEFAIIADNFHKEEDCEALLARLLATLKEPYNIMESEVKVGASIGIAIFPDDAANLDELIAASDGAMYEAKKDANKTYLFYKNSKAKQKLLSLRRP